jgi:hypothetical protein
MVELQPISPSWLLVDWTARTQIDSESRATFYNAVTREFIGEKAYQNPGFSIAFPDFDKCMQGTPPPTPYQCKTNIPSRVDIHMPIGGVVYDQSFLLPPHLSPLENPDFLTNTENAVLLGTPGGWLQPVNATATVNGQTWPIMNGILRFTSTSPLVTIDLPNQRIENFVTSGIVMVLGLNLVALHLMHDTDHITPPVHTFTNQTNPPQIPATPRCVIATAAYGSELAAPVQFLRDFRDREVESTMLGSAFMKAFNNWYYSWAPVVARVEDVRPAMRAAVRGIILPLLGALFLSHEVFTVLRSLNSELAILISGLVASSLIGLFYLTPLTVPLTYLTRRWRRRKLLAFSAPLGTALVLMGTLPNGTFGFVEVSLSLLVVETMILAPAAAARKLVEQMADWLSFSRSRIQQ